MPELGTVLLSLGLGYLLGSDLLGGDFLPSSARGEQHARRIQEII